MQESPKGKAYYDSVMYMHTLLLMWRKQTLASLLVSLQGFLVHLLVGWVGLHNLQHQASSTCRLQ